MTRRPWTESDDEVSLLRKQHEVERWRLDLLAKMLDEQGRFDGLRSAA